MIEKMKTVTVLALSGGAEDTLERLRDLGVLHVKLARIENRDIAETARKLEQLQTVRFLITRICKSSDPPVDVPGAETMTPEELAEAIQSRVQRLEEIQAKAAETKLTLEEIRPWGEFDPRLIDQIRNSGVGIWICHAQESQLPELPEDCRMIRVAQRKKNVYFVVLAPRQLELELPEVKLPGQAPSELRRIYDQLLAESARLRGELKTLNRFAERLEDVELDLIEQLEFKQVHYSTENPDPALIMLRGYCPAKKVDDLRESAHQHGWGLIVQDPDPEDKEVPTLITLPRWLEMAKPIFDIVGILPGYWEFDVSFLFLTFLTIFFAMIFGDAGYGAVFLIGLIGLMVAKPKLAKSRMVHLLTLFSVCTLIWGLLSGSIFGLDEAIVKPWYDRFNLSGLWAWTHEMKNIQALCFYIGAVHLSLAHAWRALVSINHPKCLSEIGWIGVVWGNCLLAASLVAPDLYPVTPWILKTLYLGGLGLILLFTNPTIKLHKAILDGFLSILGNGINSFVDVLSYIRLFAVGLSSYYVANSFNMIGENLMHIGQGSLLALFTFCAGLLVIIFGHVLNVMLGALGVFVHGIRLNTLEFSGHMGIEWAGIPFKPFARKRTVSQE
ncbi:MAG: hypothetical protein D6820_06920 [Lentisphaerae bacterium]|nr:MAG: hypothetical protein D6820_06920 [Lentisphaerota bacterium]